MDNRVQLLTIAYDYLVKKQKCSFKEIWNHVRNELQISDDKAEKIIGNLYTGMVLDTHFFLKSDKLWYPRSAISLDEIKYQVSSIIEEQEQKDEFDFIDDTESLQMDDSDIDDGINIVEDSYDDGDIEPVSQKKDLIDHLDIEKID